MSINRRLGHQIMNDPLAIADQLHKAHKRGILEGREQMREAAAEECDTFVAKSGEATYTAGTLAELIRALPLSPEPAQGAMEDQDA